MSHQTEFSFTSRVARYTGRLVCIGCVIWFGATAIRAVDAGAIEPAPSLDSDGDEAVLFGLEPGVWTFAGSDVSFERFVGEATPTQSRPQDASSLIAIAKAYGARVVETDEGSVWSAQTADLRIRVVTSNDSVPILVSAQVASKNDDGTWETIALRPAESQDQPDHLLPLPSDASSLCSRRSPSGSLQMELFTTGQSTDQLLAAWKTSGWDIQRTPWGEPGSFAYLCSRGESVVYAWSEDTAGLRTIMLSRTTRERGLEQ